MQPVSFPSLGSLPPELAAAANPGRGMKAAREFEAQLIGSLLESLEKTFAAIPGEGSMPGADDYSYLASHSIAQALAAQGGFGIAALISCHLPEHEGKG